jgi:hypothetical protein
VLGRLLARHPREGLTIYKVSDGESAVEYHEAKRWMVNTHNVKRGTARRSQQRVVRCVGRESHSSYETISVDDVVVCVLQIVRELVSRLIQPDVICAGHDHHDDAAVLALLDRTSELRSFRPQLADRRIDVVAHQRDRVVTRVVVRLALPFAVRRVHSHLARSRLENELIVIPILGHVLPPEHVTQKRPRCVSIVGVNQCMN